MAAVADLLAAVDRFLEAVTPKAYNRRKRRALAPVERRLERAMQSAFKRQEAVFLRLFAKFRDRFPKEETLKEAIWEFEWGLLFDQASLDTLQAFVKPLEREVQRALLAGALHSLADADVSLSVTLKNPRAVAYLNQYGARRVTMINDTTRTEIKKIVTQAVDEGWSYNRTAKAISDRYGEFRVGKPQQHIQSRAHLVAVTEAGESYSEGNLMVGQELAAAGLEMEKSWLSVGDERVSDGCRENQAAGWIPIDQAFPSGHMRPLRFPGCRCDMMIRRKREAA